MYDLFDSPGINFVALNESTHDYHLS